MILDFHGYFTAFVIAGAQKNIAACAFIAVDDGVGYSLGDGGFQVGDLAEGRTELHGEGRDSDPGEGLVLRKGRKSEGHMIACHGDASLFKTGLDRG